MLNWKPNPYDAMPLYRQLANHCKELIASGQWPTGFRLPPQRKLAAALGINRSTIALALAELTSAGLINSRIGSGVFVANDSWSLLTNPPPPDWRQYEAAALQPPNQPIVQAINKHEFSPGIIRLGTGELAPELLPQAEMRRCLRNLSRSDLPLGYEEAKGMLALRQAISERLAQLKIQAAPASIMIVSGALQAFQLICLGLLPPGAGILLEQPSYLFSLPLFAPLANRLRGVGLDAEGLLPQALGNLQKKEQAALLYTIPCFHNPTGITMSERRRLEITDLCRNFRLPILEDDVYRDLWLDDPPPLPLKASDSSGAVLYLGSLSKTLSPGLRIGWLVGPEPVIDRLADLKMQFDYGASSFSQLIAADWLASPLYDQHLQKLRAELSLRRANALTALQKHFSDLADWNTPSGGFYIWLTLRRPVSPLKLFQSALAKGILLNPGFLYDPQANLNLRLSYSYASPREFTAATKQLAALLRAMPN